MNSVKLLFLLFLIPIFASAAVYKDSLRRFSFDYDENAWEIVPQPQMVGASTDADKAVIEKTLVTVQKKQAEDKYRARFGVVVDSTEKFTGTATERFSAYSNHALKFLKDQQFQLVSSGAKKLLQMEEPAFEIIASQRNFGLTLQQVIFLKGKEAYLLTASSRIASFENNQKDLRRFFESFRFTVLN